MSCSRVALHSIDGAVTSNNRLAAWLFTRDAESVTMEIWPRGSSEYELRVRGPASHREVRTFGNPEALLHFHAAYERQLAERHFTLERFVRDRRVGVDRRAVARGGRDRRLGA